MKQQEIIAWLRYWSAAKMVAVGKILAFDQVATARKFCACMRTGVFCDELVSDLAIWRAIQEMRRQDGGIEDCPDCNGLGNVISTTPSHRSRFVGFDDLDPDDYSEPCQKCDGTGTISE